MSPEGRIALWLIIGFFSLIAVATCIVGCATPGATHEQRLRSCLAQAQDAHRFLDESDPQWHVYQSRYGWTSPDTLGANQATCRIMWPLERKKPGT